MGVGVLSGFMATTASIGGPPMALVYQHEQGSTIRGTMATYGFVGTVMSVATLAIFGEISSAEIYLTLALLPGLGVGFIASRSGVRFLDKGWMRPAVVVLCSASAMAVLLRSVL